MVARVAATSKCREKTKKPMLGGEPEETPPLYVPLYPPLPLEHSSSPSPSTSDGDAQGTVTPVKFSLEALGASTPLTPLSPIDSIPTLSPPVLTSHPPLNREHLTSFCEDLPLSSDSCCPADAPEGSPEPHVL
jgi:hypothetical protein